MSLLFLWVTSVFIFRLTFMMVPWIMMFLNCNFTVRTDNLKLSTVHHSLFYFQSLLKISFFLKFYISKSFRTFVLISGNIDSDYLFACKILLNIVRCSFEGDAFEESNMILTMFFEFGFTTITVLHKNFFSINQQIGLIDWLKGFFF